MRSGIGKVWQFVAGKGSVGRYGLIGVSGVALDFLTYLLLINVGIAPTVATVFSTLLGISNNFVWNSLLNFSTGLSSVRGAKFLTVGLTGLFLSSVLLRVFLSLGLDPVTAKWLSIPAVVGGQYLVNRAWTFRT